MRHSEYTSPAKPGALDMLQQLIDSSIVLGEDWELLPDQVQMEMEECTDLSDLLSLLYAHQLLTRYQIDRIEAGTIHGMMLGNYRILDRLGAGGMSVVFKAE